MNVFERNRPPGPRARTQHEHVRGPRRLILIHGEGGNININVERVRWREKVEPGAENPTERRVAGNGKFRGRLDEVGNGNLGVPLLPTMPVPFRASEQCRERGCRAKRAKSRARTLVFGIIMPRN